MGPDSRVLVRKSRKQAEQYHRLYKVCLLLLDNCFSIKKVNMLRPCECGIYPPATILI